MSKLIVSILLNLLVIVALLSSSSSLIKSVHGFGVNPTPLSTASSSLAASAATSPFKSLTTKPELGSTASTSPPKLTLALKKTATGQRRRSEQVGATGPRSLFSSLTTVAQPIMPAAKATRPCTTTSKVWPASTIKVTSKATKDRRPRISSIGSVQEFNEFLNEDDRLVIVNYFASWCKTCQKFELDFNAIGRKIADLVEEVSTDESEKQQQQSGRVVRRGVLRMARVDFGQNTELCKSLGVTRFPYAQIYYKGRLVDAFLCGPKKVPFLVQKLGQYLSMSPSELNFEADMYRGAILADTSSSMS